MSSSQPDVAIITGASRGIGAVIAKQLASEGFAVVINYASSANEATALVAQLRQHVQRLKATQVSIHAGDGLTWLQQQQGQGLDLVFLDPPFDGALFEPALQAAAHAIQPQGWIYLEAPRSWPAQDLAAWGLATHRFVQAGAVHAHLLRPIA